MTQNRSHVKTVDKGYNRFMRAAKRGIGGRLTIGIHPREGRRTYANGLTVSALYRIQATPTASKPARDPIAYWWNEQNGKRRIRDATREALKKEITAGPRAARKNLNAAGARYVAQVREAFRLQAPLKRSTVRRKRSSRILYDTGQLWRSIDYRATLKG